MLHLKWKINKHHNNKNNIAQGEDRGGSITEDGDELAIYCAGPQFAAVVLKISLHFVKGL